MVSPKHSDEHGLKIFEFSFKNLTDSKIFRHPSTILSIVSTGCENEYPTDVCPARL